MKNITYKFFKKIKSKINLIYKRLFSYPIYKYESNQINEYWQKRKLNYKEIKPNDFQIERAKLLSFFIDDTKATLLDIGSGDGAQLIAINQIFSDLRIIGSDKDKFACEIMNKSNFKFHILDEKVTIFDLLEKYQPKYISIFEVLEHIYSPEDLLLKLISSKYIKKIFISIPNSGYFIHRLRFLFGRFPLQWIANPNEHIRFWTIKDLNWWLKYLSLNDNSKIISYKGIPILKNLFPNLFAEGSFIVINKN